MCASRWSAAKPHPSWKPCASRWSAFGSIYAPSKSQNHSERKKLSSASAASACLPLVGPGPQNIIRKDPQPNGRSPQLSGSFFNENMLLLHNARGKDFELLLYKVSLIGR